MSIFLSIAGLMVAVALAWLLPTLLKRQRSASATTEAASNLSILRDQLAELERDLARGTLSQADYQQARDDFDRRVLEELSEPASRAAVAGSGRRIALVLGLLIPLCAGLLYWQIGSLPGLENGAAAPQAGKVSPEQVEAMVAKLAARLEQAPADADGWALLGRSYMTMQRYDQAAKAYERATSLIKNNADLYADYADALAMAQGRRIDGKPLKLVEEALRVDPNHWKALAIAGSAAFERKDYKAAIGYWEKLLARVGPALLWIAALLATLIGLDRLFQADEEDGSLDLMRMGDMPMLLVVLAKGIAHWLTTGLPLTLAAPVLGLLLAIEPKVLGVVMLSLVIGTPALTFIGAVGAALTVSVRRGGLLLAVIVMPMMIPVMIFGVATASAAASDMMDFTTPLMVLAGLSLGSIVVASLIAALALSEAS